jgi:hypothetical protein
MQDQPRTRLSDAPRQMPLDSQSQHHKLRMMDAWQIFCNDERYPLGRSASRYMHHRLLDDGLRPRAMTMVEYRQNGKASVGTYSLYCGVVHESSIATSALWMYGSVSIVLLKGFGTGVRPIADPAPMGRRSGRASWLSWDRSRASLVNLLLMLRRIINKSLLKDAKRSPTFMRTASLLQTHLQVPQK